MQNATFATFENIGLDYAALVAARSSTFATFENIGFNYGAQIPSQSATTATFENIGLTNIPYTSITHNPHGWGMVKGVPQKFRYNVSSNATIQTFENIQ
jgi:hypothetical protein